MNLSFDQSSKSDHASLESKQGNVPTRVLCVSTCLQCISHHVPGSPELTPKPGSVMGNRGWGGGQPNRFCAADYADVLHRYDRRYSDVQ